MSAKGLWVSPTQFVHFAEPAGKKLLTEHIATRGRSFDAQALGMYLPNPDPILKAQGKDIAVYRDLRSQALVGVTSAAASLRCWPWSGVLYVVPPRFVLSGSSATGLPTWTMTASFAKSSTRRCSAISQSS